MNKKSGMFKQGLLVAIGSLLILVMAFILYFMILMVFDSMLNRDGSYDFVV